MGGGFSAVRHSAEVVRHLARLGLGPNTVLRASEIKEAFVRYAVMHTHTHTYDAEDGARMRTDTRYTHKAHTGVYTNRLGMQDRYGMCALGHARRVLLA